MTRTTARTVANVVLGAAGLAVAFVIVRTPPLRRAAFRLAKAAATGSIPTFLATEAGRAWTRSGTKLQS